MAIDLLCEIIAQDERVSVQAYQKRLGYAGLIRSGLLQEAGLIQSVVCLDCVSPHDAEVVHHGEDYGYWCPDLGFLRMDRSVLKGLEPDLTNLVVKLADAFECKRRKSAPIHRATWRIGAIETPAGDLAIYLHPRLQTGQDVQDVDAALRTQVRSAFTVILTAAGSLQVPGAVTVQLSETVELASDAASLIAAIDLCVAVGATPKSKGGAPNIFENRAKAIIASRARNGEALSGRNEEALAALDAFRQTHSGEPAPSLSSMRRYVSGVRSGS